MLDRYQRWARLNTGERFTVRTRLSQELAVLGKGLLQARDRIKGSGAVEILEDLQKDFFPDGRVLPITPDLDVPIDFDPDSITSVRVSLITGDTTISFISYKNENTLRNFARSNQMAFQITRTLEDGEKIYLAHIYLTEYDWRIRLRQEALVLGTIAQKDLIPYDLARDLGITRSKFYKAWHQPPSKIKD